MITHKRKDGTEIGLFLKSLLHRISTDKVKQYLLENNITVNENNELIDTLEKIKIHLNAYNDREEKAMKTVEFADILAGKNNRVSMVALLAD